MSEFSVHEQNILLEVARKAIESKLLGTVQFRKPDKISEKLKQKCGCFVTLHKQGELRGCIGIIEPVNALIDGIEENARHAAFDDPRFVPLSAEEIDKIKIEISVLTPPQSLEYSDPEDLKHKLEPGIHGVILSKGFRKATFLPQVWDQLPDAEAFLNHLCLKAGLSGKCWKETGLNVKVYTATYFSE